MKISLIGFGFLLTAAVTFSCQKKPPQQIQKNIHEEQAIPGNFEVQQAAVAGFVDPFIGTDYHGHTYPGATVPFGMLQVSPDNGISAWDWCSGYHYSDSIAIGFSHLHLSGTGIGDLTDIRFMPVNKAVDLTKKVKKRDEVPYKSRYSHLNESASAGYYRVFLEDFNVNVELTSAKRTAYHRYTFEEGDEQTVVIDLGYAINWDRTLKSSIQIDDKKHISGYRFSKGWAKNQKVFFNARFSKPIDSVVLVSDGKPVKNDTLAKGVKTYAQLFFGKADKTPLVVQVGLSSVSMDKARLNNQKGKTFIEIKEEAKKSWENSLSKIRVKTSVDSLKTKFYTALYHAQIAPVIHSDADGSYRLENDSIGKTDQFDLYSTLSLWDTFRAEHPLLTLTDSDKVSDMINSMLIYYDHSGVLPVWTLYANETNTMTGFHSVPVIAEAYHKGIRGFDAGKAYAAMKATMMGDSRGLKYYKKYGYIPYDKMDQSVTITLEFAYDDWCVAQMAKALGKDDDYDYFMKRSEAYKYLFDKKTGFMRGKSSDGKRWNTPFDPKYARHIEHTDYTEGNAWQHSWFVLHDVQGLIDLFGGPDAFNAKLEQLFTESSELKGENVSPDISGMIGQYAHGNEPSHHIAYMFNFSGQPWRTQYWVREILKTQYFATPDGLRGNEDCGQMSAWYVLSAMGFYPYNPASGIYQIGSPLFEESTINLPEGKIFRIVAENVSDTNRYIQSATLNGKDFNRTYIAHDEILNGGTLRFKMGPEPNKAWGVTAKPVSHESD